MKMKQVSGLLLAALLLPGCSMLSKSGRQQAAYERYIRKMSSSRGRQQRIFRSSKKPMMPVNEPVESGPVSVTTGVSS
jgi:PBP1b-binding outer membrane lipoprotein LpoB